MECNLYILFYYYYYIKLEGLDFSYCYYYYQGNSQFGLVLGEGQVIFCFMMYKFQLKLGLRFFDVYVFFNGCCFLFV